MKNKLNKIITFATLVAVMWLLVGCSMIQEPNSLNVVFPSAPVVSDGSPVFFNGVRVGTVREASLQKGKIVVRVTARSEALPQRVVFLATADGAGVPCLVGFALPASAADAVPQAGVLGANGMVQLAAILGEARAQEAFASTREWILRQVGQ